LDVQASTNKNEVIEFNSYKDNFFPNKIISNKDIQHKNSMKIKENNL
jgi:hypothetical protein